MNRRDEPMIKEWPGNAARRQILIGLATLSVAALACAEGFRNPTPGAFGLGRSGSRLAHIDDSSAVYHNPANLIELTAFEAQFTPTLVHIRAEYDSPLGQSAETEDPWKILPNIFLGAPLTDSGNVAFGFGITTPYGIGSEWDTSSSAFTDPTSLRYAAPYYAELMTLNFSPGVAVKLGERLRFGAALDVLYADLTMKQFYPWAAWGDPAAPDGKMKVEGDGFGFGANIGLTWLINERHRLAITYRSPINVELDGDFKVSNFQAAAGGLGATPESSFGSEIRFPTVVALGYGLQLTDKIRVGADVEWLQFSRFKSLDIDVENNNVLLPNRSFEQNWDDTFTVGVGGDWKFSEGWVLRASYQFFQSPVPDSTFSPTIPDADQNVFTIGIGYAYKSHSFELAYGLDFYEKREIDNNQNTAFNGTYDINVHMFSAAYRYRF